MEWQAFLPSDKKGRGSYLYSTEIIMDATEKENGWFKLRACV